MKKFIGLFLGLSALILLIFAVSGDALEVWFQAEQTQQLLEENRWLAGPIGAGLLMSDLLLPIPTTIIIGALGAVLGIAAGTFWGWVGLNLAAWFGYGLARWKGSSWASVSPEEHDRYAGWFDHSGGWAVLLSRWLPILPEVLSILAGLYGMSTKRFAIAVGLGSLPPAWMYAWIGATAQEAPLRAVSLLIGTTLVGWALVQWIANRSEATKKG